MNEKLLFDVAHLLAGSMLVLSFLLLYQDRITAVINVFALQAMALALSVAWQALVQGAPHLLVTAALALVVKGFVIPMALHQIIRKLQIHREIEQVIGAGPTMVTGLILVALSILLVQPVGEVSIYTREDLAFALAVILLGLLMMITRRNAITQVVGFMSLENGLILAGNRSQGNAAGRRGLGGILGPDRLHRVRRLRVPHARALRHRRRERARSFPRRAEGRDVIGPVEAILVVPALAIPVLALISDYRLGAAVSVNSSDRAAANVIAQASMLTAAPSR
jgi:hydrogenase-4 component E